MVKHRLAEESEVKRVRAEIIKQEQQRIADACYKQRSSVVRGF
jgi:hypothetical protein